MILCLICGEGLKEGGKFCGACGAPAQFGAGGDDARGKFIELSKNKREQIDSFTVELDDKKRTLKPAAAGASAAGVGELQSGALSTDQ